MDRSKNSSIRTGYFSGTNLLLALLAAGFGLLTAHAAHAQTLDSFIETFDGFTADTTISGVENWILQSGSDTDAIVQSSTALGGTGKALQLKGSTDAVEVARAADYGGLSPIWVSYTVKPGVGGEERPAPTEGIAAVSFDFSGKVLASNGSSWVDTGVVYDPSNWWKVIYKLNFSNHTWDLYLNKIGSAFESFSPVKSGLSFVDPSINGLSKVGISGAYSENQEDNTYLDDLTITYIEQLRFTTPAQTLISGRASTPIIVELQNSLGEPQRAVQDIFIELKTTSSGGSFSLQEEPWRETTQILMLKDQTSAVFYYRDSNEGKPTLSAKEFPDYGWLEALQQQRVLHSMPHLELAASSPQIAGEPFPVTIMAKDDEGNIDSSYTGNVGLSVSYVEPNTGTKQLTPTEVSGFVGGILELNVEYPDAGTIVIEAMDFEETEIAGSSGEILLHPASLVVNVDHKQIVDRPFNIAVTGLNAHGVVTPNYSSNISLAGKAAEQGGPVGQLDPNTVPAANFDAGTGVQEVTYGSWGAVNIWATDSAYPPLNGKSQPVMFHPAKILFDVTLPPAPRDFYYIHEPIPLQMTPLSHTGEVIQDYNGVIEFDAANTLQLPPSLSAAEGGVPMSLSASSEVPGYFNLRVRDKDSGWESESVGVQVKSATIKVLSAYAPAGGTAEVTIFLVDDNGDVIDAESNAILDFSFEESNPNNSLNSSHYNYPIQLINGKATLLITNDEAESVVVTPKLPYALEVESGTVKFGRYATKSVGVLLWRELEEGRKDEGRPRRR